MYLLIVHVFSVWYTSLYICVVHASIGFCTFAWCLCAQLFICLVLVQISIHKLCSGFEDPSTFVLSIVDLYTCVVHNRSIHVCGACVDFCTCVCVTHTRCGCLLECCTYVNFVLIHVYMVGPVFVVHVWTSIHVFVVYVWIFIYVCGVCMDLCT